MEREGILDSAGPWAIWIGLTLIFVAMGVVMVQGYIDPTEAQLPQVAAEAPAEPAASPEH